ncbi:MAG: hypothetical protein E7J94_05855 [Clostridium sp.]|nr:hypothetical protein [Clostridium sp.]
MKKNMKKAVTEMPGIKKDSTEKPSTKKDSIKRISKKRISVQKVIAAAVGTALLAGWIFTADRGIGIQEKQIYSKALEEQEQADKLGFSNFRLEDYPVAMYDGKADYVFYKGSIEKRSPVLETFAGTAYPVGDHYEVIIPTLERFDGLLSLAGGVEGMVSGSGYGEKEPIATIWHEAFHAWQLSHYKILGEDLSPAEMEKELEQSGKETGDSDEALFVKEVDQNKVQKQRLEKEMQLLKAAAEEKDTDKMKAVILQYKELQRQRRENMSPEAITAEQRCELTEGTAYYVEGNILRSLRSEKEYQDRYLDSLDVFEGGRGKYYRTGMAKCLILDRLDPDWKESLDFTKSLDQLLDKATDYML